MMDPVTLGMAKADASKKYAPKQPAPTTADAKGVYDRRLNIYNLKPAQMFRGRTGLAKASAGTAFTLISAIGDSTEAGTNGGNTPSSTAISVQVRNLLIARGYPSAGTGIVAAYRAASASDTRWTYGAGWAAPSTNSNRIVNSTTSNALTFASVEAGTTTHVYYSNAGGAFTVSIDSGTAVAAPLTGANTVGVLSSPTLANTTHTISIVRTSGQAEIIGVEVRSASSGIRMFNAGIAGAKSSALADANWNAVTPIATGGPSSPIGTADIIFFCCGINDGTGGGGSIVPVATYKTNMQTAINTAKVNGATIVLRTPNPVSGTDLSPYVQALYELADTNDLPLIDIYDRWGSYAAANARSIMGDTVHPSPAGNAEIARAIVTALGL